MVKFKVGDRVVFTGISGRLPRSAIGTIVVVHTKTATNPLYGVSWDNFNDGHDIDGLLKGDKLKTGWNVSQSDMQRLVEEAKPETEKPPVVPAKPKPAKPPKPKPWFSLSDSDLDEILGMSIQIKPASEWLVSNPYETAVAGNWTAPKPQPEVSKPKPQPKKEEKSLDRRCWKCAAYQQIADCGYGFCSSWHNFAGKEELCTRFRAVETVDN